MALLAVDGKTLACVADATTHCNYRWLLTEKFPSAMQATKLWQTLANSMSKFFLSENSSCTGDAHDLLHTTREKADSEVSVWCCGSCVSKVC